MGGMMRGILRMRLIGALLACAGAACAVAPAPAAAQGSYSPYNEGPGAALARYIRTLASDPRDFGSLIGAGKAALELGDPQAAAGFFARADEVNARSPLPQAGMGAVAVANGEPQAALPYFKRAQQLGMPVTDFVCDRGLAYDLLGQQTQAQADYRTALTGADADEARRRLALSLAIGGDRNGALQILAPLSAKGDSNVVRVRAFVLALTGDTASAMSAINAALPTSSTSLAPFIQRLSSLTQKQKAAAVNLGIFPDSGAPTYAYASTSASAYAATDRLSGLNQALQGVSSTPPPAAAAPVQASYGAAPAATTRLAGV